MEVSYQTVPGDIPSIVSIVGSHKDGSPVYHYGTAGFRDKACDLETVAPRIGLISTLRSLAVNNRPIGIMITASHNHVADNGFKIIDYCGGMLAMSWESIASDITNAKSDDLGPLIQKILNQNAAKLPSQTQLVASQIDDPEYVKDSISTPKTNDPMSLKDSISTFKTDDSKIDDSDIQDLTSKIDDFALKTASDFALKANDLIPKTSDLHPKTAGVHLASKTDSDATETFSSTLDDLHITNQTDHYFSLFDRFHDRPIILIGLDTRPSSSFLCEKITQVCHSIGAIVIHYGLVTTPQLHWMVGHINEQWDLWYKSKFNKNEQFIAKKVPITSVDDYTTTVGKAFVDLYSIFDKISIIKGQPPMKKDINTKDVVYVDVAYGVGDYAFTPIAQYIQDNLPADGNLPNLRPILVPADGKPVNARAGIDYALKTRGLDLDPRLTDILFNSALQESVLNNEKLKLISNQTELIEGGGIGITEIGTENLTPKITKDNLFLFSVDGDCDRIGGLVPLNDGKVGFLDGDRFIVLFTQFLSTLIEFYGFTDDIKINIVQTAYCNGASTLFIKKKYPTVKTLKACTGVKYLLEKTREDDISVYFEQNGHGSVHFNATLWEKIEKLKKYNENDERSEKAKEFEILMKLCRDVITPYIGDACGDLLFALIALKALNLDINSCYQTYTNMFTLQCVVAVHDKNLIKPDKFQFEERLLEPIELQNEIDLLINQYLEFEPRSFVRPSGTENVVRIFVESTCQEKTEELSAKIKALVGKYGGGVQF